MHIPINFLIVAVLLILLIVVSYKTSKFGSIYAAPISGAAAVVLSPAALFPASNNGPDIIITYKLPGAYYSQGTAPANTYFYKWPLIYMFPATQVHTTPANQNAAYITSNIATTHIGFSRPSATVLGTYATTSPSDAVYAPTLTQNYTAASTVFPANMINLTNVLNTVIATSNPLADGSNPTLRSPGAGVSDNGSLYSTSDTGNIKYTLSKANTSISVPMQSGQTYIVGIAAQLNVAPPVAGTAPFTRRYGQFTYSQFTPIVTEGYPGTVASVSLDFGQLLV